MVQAQLVVIREAAEVVLRHLERLAPGDRTEPLLEQIEALMQEVEMWSAAWPSQPALEVLTKRILALHVEVTALERSAMPQNEAAPA